MQLILPNPEHKSSGGRQASASIAPVVVVVVVVVVVCMAPVIHKHASLCILRSVFMALAV